MGARKQKKALESTARSQERFADIFESLGDANIAEAGERDARQEEIWQKYILPTAEKFLGSFDTEGFDTPFPTIERPDFTGGIRRDYHDDLASIEADKNRAGAEANDYMTASGLTRSGAHGGAIGSIMRGADMDRSSARRNMQGRLEGESRDAYADQRELALLKHGDTRAQSGERAQLGLAGANIMSGQQATFNPIPFQSLGSGNYGRGLGSLEAAGDSRYRAGQLPGTFSTIAGAAGAVAGGGGLSRLWK